MATAFFYFATALACSVWPLVSSTRATDVAALQGMLRAWQGTSAALDYWSLREGADPCSSGWKGVGCSQTHSVINLDLNDANLSGGIPSAIGGLDELIILDLSGNLRLASTIPSQIGCLHRLTHLKLSGCNFSGKVPQEINNLKKLEYLDVSNNPHLLPDGDAQQLISLKRQPTSFVRRHLLQINGNNNRVNLPLTFTWVALGAVGLVALITFTFCFCRWWSLRKTRNDVFLMTPAPALTTFQSKPSSRVVHVANENENADADDRL